MEPNNFQNNFNSATLDNSGVAPAPVRPQKPKGLIVGMVICGILAIAGIAFGIYELLNSNQKSQKISDLTIDIGSKDAKISELETTISSLDIENEAAETIESETTIYDPVSATEKENETATIILGDKIDKNESRVVFKIGECTADGPSVKCSISTANGRALISYLNTDGILRLTLPNS